MPASDPRVVLRKIGQSGILPVFYHEDPEICTGVVGACYAGGLRAFAFDNTGPRGEEMYVMLKKQVQRHFPDLYLGAGAITDAAAARTFAGYQADFLVCPVLDAETGEVCRKAGMLWVPGCATPTEIAQAGKLGATLVRLFPGVALGPPFLLHVKPSFPGMQFMPSEGIDPSAAAIIPWLEAGAAALAMGSRLITPEILAIPDFTFLKERVKRLLKTIRQWRQQSIS